MRYRLKNAQVCRMGCFIRLMFSFPTAELFPLGIVFPAPRILFLLIFLIWCYFPVSLMCTFIFESRVFLIRKRLRPEPWRRRTAASPT